MQRIPMARMSLSCEKLCALLLLLLSAVPPTSAQVSRPQPPVETSEAGGAATLPPPRVWVHLADGRRLEVDEASETGKGVWFRRGTISTFLESAKVARVEREVVSAGLAPAPAAAPPAPPPPAWRLADAAKVEAFFAGRFKRRLPVTAFGQSNLHDRWGYDHRNSLDVGLHPDSEEGRALTGYLREQGIPFLSFRGPVPGVASGPHVHIGRPSSRTGVR